MAIPPKHCDIAVVGAGIVGLAVARELALRHPGASVAVIEREDQIAAHQTGSSSGVIHAGIYYRPGSLKARLCVEGSSRLFAYCAERGVPVRRDGKLIVATRSEQIEELDELERRGRQNGVEGLRRVATDEIAAIEPHATGLTALHSPATGTVDFRRVTAALAQDLRVVGGSVTLACAVLAIRESGSGVMIDHPNGTTKARLLVSCAGAWADRIAVAAGAPPDPRIVPFRGAYLRLQGERADLIRSSIYSVPNPGLPFLGAHLTRGIDGTVLLGPTALIAGARDACRLRRLHPRDMLDTAVWPGTWRFLAANWRAGWTEIRHALSPSALVREAAEIVPGLRRSDFVPGPVGIRAQAMGRDGSLVDEFVFTKTERCLHVRNAPSPAATSALALADLIADEVPTGVG